MNDMKSMNHKRLLLQRFIDVFCVNVYSAKNQNHVNELVCYGTIAASLFNEVFEWIQII